MYKKFEIIFCSSNISSIIKVEEKYANGYVHESGRLCFIDGYATFRSDTYGNLPIGYLPIGYLPIGYIPLGHIKGEEAGEKIHAFIQAWREKKPNWEASYIAITEDMSSLVFKDIDLPQQEAIVIEHYLNGKTVTLGTIKPVDGVMHYEDFKKGETTILEATSLNQAKEEVACRIDEEELDNTLKQYGH